MKFIEKIWNYLSGKKTAIGIVSHIGLFAYSVFSKNMTIKESLEYHGYISGITGVGLFHKGAKTEKGKKITKHIKDATRKIIPKQNTKGN
jgi:hypothetical protein